MNWLHLYLENSATFVNHPLIYWPHLWGSNEGLFGDCTHTLLEVNEVNGVANEVNKKVSRVFITWQKSCIRSTYHMQYSSIRTCLKEYSPLINSTVMRINHRSVLQTGFTFRDEVINTSKRKSQPLYCFSNLSLN